MITALTIAGVPSAEAGEECCARMQMQNCCARHSAEKAETKGLKEKIEGKADFILKHQKELGLTDAQAADIRKLKTDASKTCITKDAEVSIVKLDIDTALHNYPVDSKVLTSLIRQKYDLKEEKALSLADAYIKIKNSLSPQQHETLKTLWKEGSSCAGRCPLLAVKPHHAGAAAAEGAAKTEKPAS